ncbi:MAG: hypothetical protein ACTSWN_06565 [Promethearchaeota archaeon]
MVFVDYYMYAGILLSFLKQTRFIIGLGLETSLDRVVLSAR